MSLLNNNKKHDKKGAKAAKHDVAGAKSFIKPGKAPSFSKKPVKTGGARGSWYLLNNILNLFICNVYLKDIILNLIQKKAGLDFFLFH